MKRILYDCDVCDEEDLGEIGEVWPWPLRERSGPYTPPTEHHLHVCIGCRPGHSDDVLRRVEWFGVDEETVEKIYITDVLLEEEDEPGDMWLTREKAIENPYIADAIEFVEDSILPL